MSDEDHRMVALNEIERRLRCFDELVAVLKDAKGVFDAIAEDGYLNDYRRWVWRRMSEVLAKATPR